MWEAAFHGAVGALAVILYRDAFKPWLLLRAGLRRKCNECDFAVTADKPGVAHAVMVEHRREHII